MHFFSLSGCTNDTCVYVLMKVVKVEKAVLDTSVSLSFSSAIKMAAPTKRYTRRTAASTVSVIQCIVVP